MADNADDVADDYRQALEDLNVNSRLEIATLTNIAKENANHGLAIVEVITNHIKKCPPNRTLPALYVLDSVVKNVPTPYGLYFGPKLYSIFMGAYTKVDNPTRAKMNEMLKTWKQPVPGSISKKPVFPIEQVRPIENALIAAKNAAFAATQSSLQGQQQLMRGRQPVAPTRNTPTPPTGRGYQPPPHGQFQHQDAYPIRPSSGHNGIPSRATPQPAPPVVGYSQHHQQQQQQPAAREGYGAPQGISIDKLNYDIQQLIDAEKTEFARDPLDTSKQTKLMALLDLQGVVQKQQSLPQNERLPHKELMVIRDRIAELAALNLRAQKQQQPPQPSHMSAASAAAAFHAPHTATYSQPPYTATPTPPVVSQSQPAASLPQLPPAIAALLGRTSQTHQPPPPPPPPPQPVSGGAGAGAGAGSLSIDSLLGRGALATLLSGVAQKSATPTPTPPQVSTPQYPSTIPPAAAAAIAALRSPSQQTPVQFPPAVPTPAPAAAPPPADPSALLAMLRQTGLIGNNAQAAGSTPPLPIPPRFPLPGGMAVPPPPPGYMDRATIQLTPASLKLFRPHLIPLHLDALGPPCTQCGRRFKTDEEGRRRKTAHMDWHFKVHQRIVEAERRGQHRSWFVDEMDWIRSHEEADVDYVSHNSSSSTKPNNNNAATTMTTTKKKQCYMRVPEDATKVNSACPICQEKFEMKWLDEAQEWVWMDAMKVGGRIFHGTCYAEVHGGSAAATSQGYRQTPERVLGKRKAEDEGHGFRSKVKMEGY
ncbi:protein PCF11 [Podospora fimiseda]|uniref:Protein PCF11 n=1 Tax=Podospora fimiseda TaxID=252190 RepID=A0AAN7GXK2_9PEZI|nr:protein PCF11 [Podospora fimiseda]